MPQPHKIQEELMNKDQVTGKIDQAVGKVQQSVGESVGNEKLANKRSGQSGQRRGEGNLGRREGRREADP
jgi:uncharacterized protein YjbJ (UPF0337 family)